MSVSSHRKEKHFLLILQEFIKMPKYKHKKIYDFSTSKLLANFRDFDIFRENLNYKRLKKKIVTSHLYHETIGTDTCVGVANINMNVFASHMDKYNYAKSQNFRNVYCFSYNIITFQLQNNRINTDYILEIYIIFDNRSGNEDITKYKNKQINLSNKTNNDISIKTLNMLLYINRLNLIVRLNKLCMAQRKRVQTLICPQVSELF
ncbi:hypothetical protein AGLY_007716 [Aphis glycines]|uniref:Uncharacterized protein n=1 Tax=Aphis glycines TaxID=307491 RepID=A0A6G0TMT1_APHGL|nr:hypothetical protein AGLY_007716 [Aphis glycines]